MMARDGEDRGGMTGRKFQRRVEDFVCDKCGADVRGTGFTNHCPHCLWSRHVDINPGDRAATCEGLMEPVRVEPDRPGRADGGHTLTHRCTRCGHEKRNRTAENDALAPVLALYRRQADGR